MLALKEQMQESKLEYEYQRQQLPFRTLALSVRDNQIFISEKNENEKNAVNLLDQNRDMKVSEFLEKLQDIVDIGKLFLLKRQGDL